VLLHLAGFDLEFLLELLVFGLLLADDGVALHDLLFALLQLLLHLRDLAFVDSVGVR